MWAKRSSQQSQMWLDTIRPSIYHHCVYFSGQKSVILPLCNTVSVPQTWPGCLQTSGSSSPLLRFRLFGENVSGPWAFPPYFSLPQNAHLWRSRFHSLNDYAWQVEIAAPVTLMISEVTLRPQRRLGRTASRKLMSIPARPGTIKRRGFQGEREGNKLETSASGKNISEGP